MNAPAKAPTAEQEAAFADYRAALAKVEVRNASRLNELGLAAAALFGLANYLGPVSKSHRTDVMETLDNLFGLTPAESDQASDRLFECTTGGAIADYDRPRILGCATELTRIAANYHGTSEQDREIWLAGFELLEIDSLWEASQPPERRPLHDPVFGNTVASHRHFGRL